MSTKHDHTSLNLPDWMLNSQEQSNVEGKVIRLRFLGKTLRDIRRLLAEGIRNEAYASRPGLLQGIDPRIKLICALSLLFAAGLTRSFPMLIFLSLFSAGLMAASRLPVWSLQKRIWCFIPVITVIAALPGMLGFFNPGTPLWTLSGDPEGIKIWGLHLNGPIYLSKQGVMAALFLFLRVGVSISIGSLLVLTTPVSRLLSSLRILGAPGLFVMTIEMSYRYIILLLTTSLEMFEARKLRTVGSLPGTTQRAMVGSSIAALFSRSMSLSEEVYQSMTARGYTGEAVNAEPFALSSLDFFTLAIIIGLAFIIALGGTIFGW